MDITRDNLLSLIQSGLKQHTMSIAGLEKLAGVPKDTVRDFLRAKTQILRADKLQKILRVLQPESKLIIRSVMGAGGLIVRLPETQQTVAVDYPAGLDLSSLEAVRIEGDAMTPVFNPGWVVCYSTSPAATAHSSPKVPYGSTAGGAPYAELLGKPCVIALNDGRLMLRTLKQGKAPSNYSLIAYNAPDIETDSIKTANKIVFIQPN